MKAFEIIQMLTKELIPVDRCGTSKFETSDLWELSRLFGDHYYWDGQMFKGNVFYCYNDPADDWTIEDADIIGLSLDEYHSDVYIFQVKE